MNKCCSLLVKSRTKEKIIHRVCQKMFFCFFFRLLSSAGLLLAHCSKTAKYVVKGLGGIIGSEYVSYYTVVAC